MPSAPEPALVSRRYEGLSARKRNETGTATPSNAAAAKLAVWTWRREKTRGSRKTVMPPAARPNNATEMARNAKWYHITTERTRVRETSSRRSAAVTANSPAATQAEGRSDDRSGPGGGGGL